MSDDQDDPHDSLYNFDTIPTCCMTEAVSIRQHAVEWCKVNLLNRHWYFVGPVHNRHAWVTSFYFDQPGDAALFEMYQTS